MASFSTCNWKGYIKSKVANNFKNLCKRVTAFAIKNCDGKIPQNISFNKDDLKILDKFKINLNLIRDKIDKQDVNYYIDFIVNTLFDTNKYFNDQEPWKKKNDMSRLNTIVYTTLEIVRKISYMLYPIIPQSSLNALKIFSINEKDISLDSLENHLYLKGNEKINKIDILFKKIEKK